MSSQQQGIIEDEPLRVLGLFHKRQLSTISFNEQKFLKLYDSLCCTICRQLFNNPVYLKCSHRFCKQCIEKYIRFNEKKSCPNCRGDLNTKRDLRVDLGLTTLIHYAFGDRQKFIEDMTQIENAEAIILQRSNSKTSAIVRSKSFIQEEQKIQQSQQSIKKKVKMNQGLNEQDYGGPGSINMSAIMSNANNMNMNVPLLTNEQQKSRKKKTNKPSQNNKTIEDSSRTEEIRAQNTINDSIHMSIIKDDTKSPQKPDQTALLFSKTQSVQVQRLSSFISINSNDQTLIKAQQGQAVKTRKKRGRKKQIPIIEVKSHTSQEPQQMAEIPNMELQQKPQGTGNVGGKRESRSVSVDRISVNTISKNKIDYQSEKLITDQAETRYDTFQNERKLLKEEFGENYMLSLMKVPTIDFLIEIKLQKHPQCFLTPIIPCKSIQISTKSKINNLFVLMSKLLNLPIKNINLSVNSYSQKMTKLSYESQKEKSIGSVNEDIWKTASDVQVFDMKQILSSLEDVNINGGKGNMRDSSVNRYKKRLFAGIEFQKQQRLPQPRKRGRGRAKKTQDKQNNTDLKEEFKRILYYQIVTQ